MFIDIHSHLRFHPIYTPRPTPEELWEEYRRRDIEKAVILPTVNPECAEGFQSVEELLEKCRDYPWIIPFCNIDPRMLSNSPQADLVGLARHYKQLGCKGIGELAANLEFLDPRCQNLFHAAAVCDLPVTFHIGPYPGRGYGVYDDVGLPQLEETLKRFPTVKFFAHSQAFWAEIGELDRPDDRAGYPEYPVRPGRAVELLRRYPNLYGDLSAGSGANALTRDRKHAIGFLNEFQDKLMFGTDLFVLDQLRDFLLELRAAGAIAETVFRKVARENAIRLLALE